MPVLSLFWDELETEAGVNAPKDNWPLIANLYFPSTGLAYTLTLRQFEGTANPALAVLVH